MDLRTTQTLHRDLHLEQVPGVIAALAAAGLAIALADTTPELPPSPAACGLAMLFGAPLLWWLAARSKRWTAEIIQTGVLLFLALAWSWIRVPGMSYVLVVAVVVGALVGGWRGTVSTTVAVTLLIATEFLQTGPSARPHVQVWVNLAVVWMVGYLLLLSYRSERTMLTWAWEGYHESREHLDAVRKRQLELRQTMEDLELVNREVIRLNDMLVASRQAVEDARMTKEAFVANVSHELRTPLNMIIGFSDEILERPEAYASRLPAELLDDVAAIRRNSEHLAGLVDDILDLSEAETGHMRLLYEPASVREIVDEAVQQVSLLFEKKGLSLEVQVPPDLPILVCDRDRLRQVVLNILSNAGRFTEQGGAAVRASLADGMVRIAVSDTGPGVRSDVVARLFEPFQQADPSIRRRHGGTGLGLAISKRLIEMHGGQIWMESQLGSGSTVTCTLPLEPPKSPDPTIRWFSPHSDSTPRDRESRAPAVEARPGLVIVEEGDMLTQIAHRHLAGLEPITAHTLPEARKLVDAGSAVGVMVNASSYATEDVMGELAHMRFDVPLFNCWMPDIYNQGRALHVLEYLVKPILRTQMIEAVQRIAPHGRTLVLADDDPEARGLYGRILGSMEPQWTIRMAADGEEALVHMREAQPDLVLLDLFMPRKDGFAVLREKAADPQICEIPVILISARDPQREPIVSDRLSVRRWNGLSGKDLVQSVEALTHALTPRFGVRAEPETRAP
jgi:signal transduction histidine kinase/CheY-like chemotaxis protein